MEDYVPRKEVLKVLKIHYQTLFNMVNRGDIEAVKIGYKNFYNLKKYLREQKINSSAKKNICYCRVSSKKQKPDLERQIKFMEKRYPDYEIISDIASGLNFERKGLKKIIEMGVNGEINKLVIAYKDRLARFGYELIIWILKRYSDTEIIIINKKEEDTPANELTKDIISIMNVFVAKVNGLRKYKKKMVKKIKKSKEIE